LLYRLITGLIKRTRLCYEYEMILYKESVFPRAEIPQKHNTYAPGTSLSFS
jgi:hypothetical protein